MSYNRESFGGRFSAPAMIPSSNEWVGANFSLPNNLQKTVADNAAFLDTAKNNLVGTYDENQEIFYPYRFYDWRKAVEFLKEKGRWNNSLSIIEYKDDTMVIKVGYTRERLSVVAEKPMLRLIAKELQLWNEILAQD